MKGAMWRLRVGGGVVGACVLRRGSVYRQSAWASAREKPFDIPQWPPIESHKVVFTRFSNRELGSGTSFEFGACHLQP